MLAAWLNAGLAEVGGKAVVVGGAALEFYTRGGYATKDLDLVSVDRVAIGRLLDRLGFERHGRHWISEELELAVEVLNDTLMVGGSPASWQLTAAAEFSGIGEATILSVEDLIVDRLLAAKFWSDEASDRWARVLLRSWLIEADPETALDYDYLRRLAAQEDVADALERLLREEGMQP